MKTTIIRNVFQERFMQMRIVNILEMFVFSGYFRFSPDTSLIIIILAFQYTADISYNNIKTSDSTSLSVPQEISSTWTQPRHPTSTSKHRSSTSPTVTQTSCVDYLGTIKNEHLRAINDAVETSNVNVKMGEPNITI